MQQHNLSSPKRSDRNRKRIGRGDGSGHGSFSGRGMKGQKSRSGGGVRPGFEGGQLPLAKALPMMRGFTNIFRKEYEVINLSTLAKFPAHTEVTPALLVREGIIKNLKNPIKILGQGELEQPLMVEANRFSRSARNQIEAVGGSVREIK